MNNTHKIKVQPTLPIPEALNSLESSLKLRRLFLYFSSIITKRLDIPLTSIVPEEIADRGSLPLPEIILAEKLQKLGLIKTIRQGDSFPDEPRIHRIFNGSVSGGVDFFDKQKAWQRMIGESAERNIWFHSEEFYDGKTTITPFGKIKNKALNIMNLPGFTKDQKKNDERLDISENTPFAWIPAYCFTYSGKKYVPLQLVSAKHFSKEVRTGKEKMLRWGVSTGVAVGTTFEKALLSGLLEVIERDSFMITYLNSLSCPRIDLEKLSEADEQISDILGRFKRYLLEVHIVSLATDFPVPVYTGVIIDRTGKGPAITFGAKASFDKKEAIIGALAEALSVRLNTKRRNLIPNTNNKKDPLKERVDYWSDINKLPLIEFFVKGPLTTVTLETNTLSTTEQLNIIRNSLKEKKYESYYVDITPKNVRRLGLYSVVALIPDLQPLHLNEELPYWGGERLQSVPKTLGYETASEINKEPHPFP